MDTIYVRAASKKSLNERLANGEEVVGVVYSPWGKSPRFLRAMGHGTIVKIWSKKSLDGVPIAKCYGSWSCDLQRVR